MKVGLIFVRRIKRIFRHIAPVLLAAAIAFGVVASDYETARATGIEELLYYTYWDLINSLFVAEGYSVSYNVDQEAPADSRVTGKQVWDHICYDFEQFLKFAMPTALGGAMSIYQEFCSLPNTASQAGLTVSQGLWDALRDYAEWCIANRSEAALTFQQNPTLKNYLDMYGLDYSSVGKVPSTDHIYGYNGFLSVKEIGCDGKITYWFFSVSPLTSQHVVGIEYGQRYYSNTICGKCGVNYSSTYQQFFNARLSDGTLNGVYGVNSVCYCVYVNGNVVTNWAYFSSFSACFSSHSTLNYTFFPSVTKVPAAETVSITATPSACPEEVPEVVPWEVHPAIPDGWRVVQPNEDPDQDSEEDPDRIPAVIPFRPNVRPTPDNTEDPDSTEDPDTNKPVKPYPGIQINPETGNVIDPTTGYDIDPDTGYLIQPGTGLLINPVTGEVIDPETGEATGVDPVVAGKYGNITKLFPFCIPFDIINMVKGMQAEKAPPVFHFEYHFDTINYTFEVDVDLSDYDQYIQLFRSGMKIFWIIALMFLTVKVSALFI